jgi:lipopolysaccharide export system permease protein
MKILFITANRIGDAVLSTGLLAWLIGRYPDAAITLACGPVAQDLFRAAPNVERLIVMRKQKRHGHWIALWRACWPTRWDLIVDLRNSLVSRLLRAKKRAYRPAHKSDRHRVEDNAKALNLVPPPAPLLWFDSIALDTARARVGDAAPILALGPAANWPAKQWPIERFVLLARALTAPEGPLLGAKILLAAAAHEREQLQPFYDAFPPERLIDTVGLDLLSVGACLQKAALFIGNDSGLMHMAAAAGVPTLGLFGPGFEKVYGPWGPRTAVVRTPESTAQLLARLPYPGAFHPNLMGSLTVEAVLDAAKRLLSGPELC